MADFDQKYSPIFLRIMDIVQIITTLTIGGCAMIGILFAALLNIDVSTHVYLVITGYIILCSQAVMSMNPTAGWTKAFSYEHRRNIHLALQVMGAILAIAGSGYAMTMQYRWSRSTHGIMGILTLTCLIITLIGGCVHAFARKLMPQSITKMCHTFLGCATITFALITFIFGVEKLIPGTEAFNLVIVLAVISILGIWASPVAHFLRKKMN